jgi:hypothetical protein
MIRENAKDGKLGKMKPFRAAHVSNRVTSILKSTTGPGNAWAG